VTKRFRIEAVFRARTNDGRAIQRIEAKLERLRRRTAAAWHRMAGVEQRKA
jgi:hypothetical protein